MNLNIVSGLALVLGVRLMNFWKGKLQSNVIILKEHPGLTKTHLGRNLGASHGRGVDLKFPFLQAFSGYPTVPLGKAAIRRLNSGQRRFVPA